MAITISGLELFPASASVGEGNGNAYVLGVVEVAGVDPALLPSAVYALSLRLQDATVQPDFVDAVETYALFGLLLPSGQPASHQLDVQLGPWNGRAASNVLSATVQVTQDLDGTFGSGGMVIRDDVLGSGGIAEEARAVALQPDGRIVVGGLANGALVERYLPDGTPDASFGAGGRFVLASPWTTHEVHAVAVQPDGKILAAGTGPFGIYDGPQAMVFRLLTDGTLDPSFGTGGLAVSDFHYDAAAHGIALQPDGRIVVVGEVSTGTDVLALVQRYTAGGTLDPSFGEGGIFRYSDPAGGWDRGLGVAVDGAGRVVVAGSTSPADAIALTDLLVLRLAPDGALDPTFGTGGAFRWDLLYDTGYGVGVQQGGRIVVGGGAWDYASANNLAFALGITSDGRVDTSFADGGHFESFPLAPYGMMGNAFALSASGAPILAGYRDQDAVVIRLTPDGALATSFSVDGFAAASSGGIAHGSAVAVQPDGRAVLAGWSTYHDQYSDSGVLLARFLAP